MSEMKVTGEIVKIGEPNIRGEWTSCSLTVKIATQNPKYPKYAIFSVSNKIGAEHDNVGNLSKFNKVGDTVDVDFNLDGFTWADKDTGEPKYANQLKAWRVRKAELQTPDAGSDIDEQLEDAPW